MLTVVKHYRFHAAHRNRELRNKCSNIHGHTYHLTCTFAVAEPNPTTGVTIEFAELDSRAEIVFSRYDHAMIIHEEDPLLEHLRSFEEDLRLVVLKCPTSAENLAREIHCELLALGLPLVGIQLYETPRSAVKYESPAENLLSFAAVDEELPTLPREETRQRYETLQRQIQTMERKVLSGFGTSAVQHRLAGACFGLLLGDIVSRWMFQPVKDSMFMYAEVLCLVAATMCGIAYVLSTLAQKSSQ